MTSQPCSPALACTAGSLPEPLVSWGNESLSNRSSIAAQCSTKCPGHDSMNGGRVMAASARCKGRAGFLLSACGRACTNQLNEHAVHAKVPSSGRHLHYGVHAGAQNSLASPVSHGRPQCDACAPPASALSLMCQRSNAARRSSCGWCVHTMACRAWHMKMMGSTDRENTVDATWAGRLPWCAVTQTCSAAGKYKPPERHLTIPTSKHTQEK